MSNTPHRCSSFQLLLSLCLCSTLLLSPITSRGKSASSIAQTRAASGGVANSQDTDVDSFIIEVMDGVSTCRGATPDEVSLTLPRADDPGVPIDNLPIAKQPSDDQSTGLTINFVALGQLQNDPNMATVVAAFQRAAAVWTGRIKSPITISMNIDYGVNTPSGAPFGSNTLGSTSSRRATVDYQGARTNLLAGSSSPAETSLYNLLPNSVVPTDVGNGGVVSANRSVAFALGIPVPGSSADQNVATIGFNKNFPFDFNPDDGISGGTDFVAVATHEIGHALGFTSGAGQGATAMVSLWDLYRFRPGTTLGTFPTAMRIMSIGGGQQVYFTGESFLVNGLSKPELGLSTGGPSAVTTNGGDGRQSSHWKDDGQTGGEYIGIMDPTIAANVHKETTENDFLALETIGWNLVSSNAPPPAPPAPPPPANDNFANAQSLGGCSGSATGLNVGATAEPNEPNHSPDNGGGTRSVWYQWTAPNSGSATITTAGSAFDTVLGVYTGSCVGALSPVGPKSDDIDANDKTSTVTFNATGGTTYRIAVDGYNNSGSGGDCGSLVVNWGGDLCNPTSIQFASATTHAAESLSPMAMMVSRTGNTSGVSTVKYATSDTAGSNACNQFTGVASSLCDYIQTVGTLTFAAGEASKDIPVLIVNDVYAEGAETFTLTLSNATGAALGASTATLTIDDNDSSTGTTNPIDTPGFFVRQHYLDFLNREPDSAGLNFWTNEITTCGGNAQCIEVKRINVSAAFFLSIEFQQTGYYVERMYKAAYGSASGASTLGGAHQLPVPIVRWNEFLSDKQQIGEGVVVGQAGWEQLLDTRKNLFAADFAQRNQFITAFPANMTPALFVDTLNTNAGNPLSSGERNQLVTDLTNATKTRAQVLRSVAEDADLVSGESNRAFVLVQYFGYLRRNPNDTPDSDYTGYDFWLSKLNQFNGNFVNAEMVKAFLLSREYRERFGPP